MAIEKGYWRSEPKEPLTKNGAIANMVVRLVISIGLRRLLPPTRIDFKRELPDLK